MKVKHGVFGSMDNNCYLLIDEKTNYSALVDCTVYNQDMIDLIGNTDLKYILLTHGHYDHIIGAKQVKEQYGCKLAISAEDAPMLTSGTLSLAAFCGSPQNNVDPDVLLKDNDEIQLGETKITVLATPGHTKGSVCYLTEDGVFSGDTLFRASCGRTDFPNGSAEEMRSSLKRLRELKGDLKVYPGHDALSSLEYERNNNPYMK